MKPAADGEYSWGSVIKSAKDARPGDILQFEKATFQGQKTIVDDQGMPALVISRPVSFPHHTAIIEAVGPKGKTLKILHQNVSHPDGTRTNIVEEAVITPSQLRKGGSMKIYRPVAP